jgi:hypothetical protein
MEDQHMPARKTAPTGATAPKRTKKAAVGARDVPKRGAALAARPKAAKAEKPAKAGKPVETSKVPKADKGDKASDKNRKLKLVRDSFTMPKVEYVVLDALKGRAAKLGRPVKKSELLRAGVMALADMGDAAFLASVTGVPTVKTGRPAKTAAR